MPTPIDQFLNELEVVLGADLVGVILFGSWAIEKRTESSDLDLAVVVSDTNPDRARIEAFRVLERSALQRDSVSMSVETYLRLKDFVGLGDPFAWVVCTRGRILHDRNRVLEGLQTRCREGLMRPIPASLVRYLQNKAHNHRVQAIQSFQQFLSHAQLCVMAAAQGIALHDSAEPILCQTLVDVSEWKRVEPAVRKSLQAEDVRIAAMLVEAHKHVRVDPSHAIADLPNKLLRIANALAALLEKVTPDLSNSKVESPAFSTASAEKAERDPKGKGGGNA